MSESDEYSTFTRIYCSILLHKSRVYVSNCFSYLYSFIMIAFACKFAIILEIFGFGFCLCYCFCSLIDSVVLLSECCRWLLSSISSRNNLLRSWIVDGEYCDDAVASALTYFLSSSRLARTCSISWSSTADSAFSLITLELMLSMTPYLLICYFLLSLLPFYPWIPVPSVDTCVLILPKEHVS